LHIGQGRFSFIGTHAKADSTGGRVRRLEVFTGYEYLDIDNSQFSALIGGVRLWF